jgi:putative MATE family efflux protein
MKLNNTAGDTDLSAQLALGTGKISSLLAKYSIPAIIAMTASSIYNVTDSIFIGQGVDHLALAGLTVTFPFMNLSAAFGSLVGVGASTLVSIKLGQKDYASANRVLGNVMVLNIVIGVLFALATFPFLDPILYFFGASENTIGFARDYMTILLLGNVFTHLYFGLNAVLRSAGYPNMSMYATLLSVGVNCILTPLFIFSFGWGIKGAAWATVIAQLISLVLQLFHFADKRNALHFQQGIYRLDSMLTRKIFSIGLSPFMMNSAACLVVILINQGLARYGGDIAISAYGIVNRVLFLFAMIIMGFNQGMQPIAGYNFGAKNYARVISVTRLTIIFAVGIATLGFLMAELFPGVIVRMFTPKQELIDASTTGLRIVFIVFPFAGFQMVASNFFMSIGLSMKAIFLSLTRQVLFLIPCLLILPYFFQTKGIWFSLPVADSVSTLVAIVMFGYQLRKMRN